MLLTSKNLATYTHSIILQFCNFAHTRINKMPRDRLSRSQSKSRNSNEVQEVCELSKQRFSNFQGIAKILGNLYNSERLSDVTINVNGAEFYAHRLILSASSDVFEAMFTDGRWCESKSNSISLTEEENVIEFFPTFLSYLYTGDIELSCDSVMPIMAFADKYSVSHLSQLCHNFISQNLVTALNHSHCCEWLCYAHMTADTALFNLCYTFIRLNFELVMASGQLWCLPQELLCNLVEDDSLVVSDEYLLYEAVMQWAGCNTDFVHNTQRPSGNDKKGHIEYLLRLFSAVKFPMMTNTELLGILRAPWITGGDKITDLLKLRLAEALEFHLNPPLTRPNDRLYFPRNYINETWATFLDIDNLSQLEPYSVRSLIFSSPSLSLCKQLNWNLDIYPKGIRFSAASIIRPLGCALVVSETKFETIRLVLHIKSPGRLMVELNILIYQQHNGVVFIGKCVQRRCIFTNEITSYKLEELLPYDELNGVNSPYRIGPNKDTFRLAVIVKPMTIRNMPISFWFNQYTGIRTLLDDD